MGGAAKPMGAISPASLLERETELAALEEALAAGMAGTGALVLIEGPAGIGKTALLAAARGRARELELATLAARGSELGRSAAYGAVREMFAGLLERATPSTARRVLAGAARPARHALGDAPEELPADAAFGVLHGLYWMTANIAEATPLALLVDDAHWLDAPSLRFLGYLARRLDGLSVVVLVATRLAEPGARSQLLDELRLDDSSRILRPAPLSSRSVGEVVLESFSREAHPGFCTACAHASAGNPFLLRELLRSMALEDVAPDAEHAELVERIALEPVARRTHAQLARIDPAAPLLASVLAVLGEGAALRHGAALAGIDAATSARLAEELVRVELLSSADPVAFAHPLVRRALHDGFPADRREAAHLSAAALLTAEGMPSERIAAHVLETRPHGRAESVRALRGAAADALARGAPEVAALLLERALAEPPPRTARVAVLRELGAAQVQLADEASVDNLRQALAVAEDDRTRAEVTLELGLALNTLYRHADAYEVLGRALDSLDPSNRALRRSIEDEMVLAAIYEPKFGDAVRERVEEATASAEQGELTPMLRAALGVIVAADSDRPAQDAVDVVVPLLELPQGDPYNWGALDFCGQVLLWCERYDDVRRLAAASLVEARTRGSARRLAVAHAQIAEAALRSGRLDEAETESSAALAVIDAARLTGLQPFVLQTLVDTLTERRELDKAESALARAPEPWPPTAIGIYLSCARGRLRLAQGRAQDALTDLLRAGEWARPYGGSGRFQGWQAPAAIAASLLGNREQAVALARDEVEIRRRAGAPGALGVALRAAALVGDPDERVEALEQAVSALEESQAKLELARALGDLGGALRRANARAAARPLLERSFDLAQSCRATALAATIRDELLATGARPRRAMLRSGLASLTASERRVAQLAADGMTNPEIAQTLFITRKTVEMHLGRAYRKLDISSRSELGSALAHD